jgi:hypothetical protein
MTQLVLPLHECVDPAAAESANLAAVESADPATAESAVEPLHIVTDPAAGVALTETSS